MKLHSAAEFASDSPPERIMGTETEYDAVKILPADTYTGEQNRIVGAFLRRRGMLSHNGFTLFGSNIAADVKHVEYATPECLGPLQAAAADHAGVAVMEALTEGIENVRPSDETQRRSGAVVVPGSPGEELRAETKGYHINLLVPPKLDPKLVGDVLMSHLASRQIWNGTGFVAESYYLSQKASGIGQILATNFGNRVSHGQKPAISMLTDSLNSDKTDNDFGIVEVRFADPNMGPYGTYMSCATLSLVLRLIEQGVINANNAAAFTFDRPLDATKKINADPFNFNSTAYNMASGKPETATGLDAKLAELAVKLCGAVNLPADEQAAAHEWLRLNDELRANEGDDNYAKFYGRVEWMTKYDLMRRYVAGQLDWNNYEAVAFDQQFTQLGKKSIGLIAMRHFDPTLATIAPQIRQLQHEPPQTRAKMRSQLIAEPGIAGVNWNQVRFMNGKKYLLNDPYDPDTCVFTGDNTER